MKKFVVESLAKEINELHADLKSRWHPSLPMLEEFAQALAKEIAEFNEDKKDVAETKVRLVREETPSQS